MEVIWVRQDGTIADADDPDARKFVAAESHDEVLAQNEWLRADFMRVVSYYPWPSQRNSMERRVEEAEPSQQLADLRANVLEGLRFPVFLRKMWTGREVQEWLEEQAEKIRHEEVKRQAEYDRSE